MNDSFASKESWVIVGGGALGLAVARKLLDQKKSVTVLEAAPTIGGLASAWSIGDVVWDRFYHVTLLSDRYLRELLTELDLEREIDWVKTKTGFYSSGRLYSLSSSLDFLTFPILSPMEKMRLGATIFFASKRSDWENLERLTVEQWLRKWSGTSVFDKIWLPLLKCKLGDSYQRTNAAFIWAYIQRMYAARRSGMKQELFGIVNGGYRRVMAAWHENLSNGGVSIRCGVKVTKVAKNSDLAESERLRFRIEYSTNGESRQIEADNVVVTLPSSQVAQIVEPLSEAERQAHAQVEYLGVVCTSILLDQPLGGYYVTNITDPGIPVTGVIEMGAILPPEKLGGHYLVYLPQYLLAESDRFNEPDSSVHQRCLATLERMYPHFDRSGVRAIQTARARHVMSLPTLEYSKKRAPVKCDTPGLFVLNSARIVDGTLNVNEVLRLVENEFGKLIRSDHP
ncbi:FAD-dependent oxidoreductase [Pirellulaceae bacterium SH449]